MKKVAILGYELEGQSSLAYWQAKGAEVTICDLDTTKQVPAGVATQLGPDYLRNLDQFDVLMRTPGMKPSDILAANPGVADKISSNVNEFLAVCPTKNVIGITGTKGKGTTSTLTARMLEAAGKRVHLGGNIGVPPLALLNNDIQPDDWVVLELSSFQLIDTKRSPHMAVCVMVVPEHLNWHKDMDEYLQAKQQLFAHQSSDDIAIYYSASANSQQIAAASPGHKIPYYQPPGAVVENGEFRINNQTICSTSEAQLIGEHNWQNICAAITTVWQISQDAAALRDVITSFSGLEHRLEFVREIDGVKYYDDSFGTTPETAMVAIQAFRQPKVVILGGVDKGADFSELARTLATSDVRRVILIGNTDSPVALATPKIEAALQAENITNIISLLKAGGSSMKEIVETAHQAAQPGDVVLLSTACASFDMFTNYKERGQQFKQAVQALV